MQMAITLMAVVGGMILSLAVALLAEELIFGQLIRVFFVRRAVALHAVAKKDGQGALRRSRSRDHDCS
jgi:hypothetical protein